MEGSGSPARYKRVGSPGRGGPRRQGEDEGRMWVLISKDQFTYTQTRGNEITVQYHFSVSLIWKLNSTDPIPLLTSKQSLNEL